jgi:amidase
VEESKWFDGELHEFMPLFQKLINGPPVFRESYLQPMTRWLREAGRKVTLDSVRSQQLHFSTRIRAWFGDADLWLSPTTPQLAPRVGQYAHLVEPAELFHALAPLGAFTAIFNVSGQPAMTIPTGLSTQGLPMGVQLAGRPGADIELLSLALQLEQAMPWKQHYPRMWGHFL